jgi:hypothetical protein
LVVARERLRDSWLLFGEVMVERLEPEGCEREGLEPALLLLAVVLLRDALLLAGGGSFTPARRAFDNPIAMACFVLRTPCLPWRT